MKSLLSFTGRISRGEFWIFLIMGFLFNLVLLILLKATASRDSIIQELGLFVFISGQVLIFVIILAASVKRLHDLNHPGWNAGLLFIPGVNLILLLFLLVSKGNKHDGEKYKKLYK